MVYPLLGDERVTIYKFNEPPEFNYIYFILNFILFHFFYMKNMNLYIGVEHPLFSTPMGGGESNRAFSNRSQIGNNQHLFLGNLRTHILAELDDVTFLKDIREEQ